MWWILGAIVGIIGIARAILDALRFEVAAERQRWETSFKETEAEVLKYQKLLNEQLATAQQLHDFKKLSNLHTASRKVADSTRKRMHDAFKVVEGMGRAIVNTAQQRRALEERKRHAKFWQVGRLEAEIQSCHKLRDEILQPDKDRVKAERDRLKEELIRLNNQTAQLRDLIKERCGKQGEEWYKALMERTDIRQKNKEREKLGLPPLPILQINHRQIDEYEGGVVKWYNSSKEYGFIKPDSGDEDLHVSRKNLVGIEFLREGDRVEFVRRHRQGEKGSWAALVKKI